MEKFETAFKIVIFFTHKSDGTPYNEKEIKELKHRHFLGSFDTRRGKFKHLITDHREAFRKMEALIRGKYHNKYTTAFILANNYNGYAFVIRKYVYGIYKQGLSINFVDWQDGKGTNKYFLPDAENLIKMYKLKLLSPQQEKLIKEVDNSIPVCLPYCNTNTKGAETLKSVNV